MSPALVLVAAALIGQGAPTVPPELRRSSGQTARTVDPALPATIRDAVEQASAAELDPKRGAGNAIEILKARRALLTETPDKLQVDLRVAGVLLRSRFLNDAESPANERPARALSTFSRLDLSEPGLGAWLDRAIDGALPAVKTRFKAKDGRRIRVHVAAQGAGIEPDEMFGELARLFKAAGVELVKASPKDADFALKVAALEVRDEGGQATVRVTLDMGDAHANAHGDEPPWRRSLYRTALAPDAKQALRAGLAWLARIGGRDLLFRWLDERGLEGVIMFVPGGDGHGHEGHGHGAEHTDAPGRAPIVGAPRGTPTPRVQLPSNGKQPSPPKAP